MPIYKTDKKKNGLQQYKVVVNYTDAQGNYRQKTKLVYGKDEANLTEHSMLHETKTEPNAVMTLQVLFEEYVAAKKHETRESSLDKSKNVLNCHILPYFKNTKLKNLTTKTLQKWKNEINEKQIATVTKNNIYKEFRALLNFGVKMEYLPNNPLTKLGNFKDDNFESQADKLHYYTAEQFKEFISVAKARCEDNYLNTWGLYVFFNIAFYTGMRKGEINALKWTDIEGDVINVRRSVTQKIKGKDIVETPPKNKSSYRQIKAPKRLLTILEEHRARQMQIKGYSPSFRVCGGHKCLADTSIANFNNECADAANLPRIRVHDFRHTHASLLINEGINVQEIARRLGHSNVQMTWNTYAHLYPREEDRALVILDSLDL